MQGNKDIITIEKSDEINEQSSQAHQQNAQIDPLQQNSQNQNRSAIEDIPISQLTFGNQNQEKEGKKSHILNGFQQNNSDGENDNKSASDQPMEADYQNEVELNAEKQLLVRKERSEINPNLHKTYSNIVQVPQSQLDSQIADDEEALQNGCIMRTRYKDKRVCNNGNLNVYTPTTPQTTREMYLNPQQMDKDSNIGNSRQFQSQSNEKEQQHVLPASQVDRITKQESLLLKSEVSAKVKKSGQLSYEDCLKTYENMFMFNWDLKDITNSRHNPRDDPPSSAFWFYFNTTFFPHDLQQRVTNTSFTEWVSTIQANINSQSTQNLQISTDQQLNGGIQLNQNSNNQLIPGETQNDVESQQDTEQFAYIQKLAWKRKRFNKFKMHFQHLNKRAQTHQFDDDTIKEIHEKSQDIAKSDQEDEEDDFKNTDDEIAKIEKKIHKQNFQKMLALAEEDLEVLQGNNMNTLKNLYNDIQSKFENSLKLKKGDEGFQDMNVYKGEEILKYSNEFLAFINPAFVQDMVINNDWYQQNMNKFLFNINYPSKLQTDCMKMIELGQQKRNDQKYKKILNQLDEIDHIKEAISKGDEQAVDLLKEKEKLLGLQQVGLNYRAQISQEDACCAICGVGDYEDDDQIVFCGRCSVPVHQQCYGIENIPNDVDWMCNNCITCCFDRGLMIECILCPKMGGAMKPTNIYSSEDKMVNQKTSSKHMKKFNSIPQLSQNNENSQDCNHHLSRQQVMNRMEPNQSLTSLLERERAFQCQTIDKYDQRLKQIELAKKDGTLPMPELTPQMVELKKQEEFEFLFNKIEQQNQNIPEDYANFIKRNESKLELKSTPVTDTLYHWVHHSCALWMKEPVVTPKTPVKMNKLDFTRFGKTCILCGHKGYDYGACVKCLKVDCDIYLHVECAKRSGYCMEIDKKGSNRERVFRIYCESHRPFKIISEINKQNLKCIEEIQKFTKIIEKGMEIQQKQWAKPIKVVTKSEKTKMIKAALHIKKQELTQQKKESKLQPKPKKDKSKKLAKAKKWRECDKKQLLNRVKEKYLSIMKMRMNLINFNPMIAENKRYKREVKRLQKEEERKRKVERKQIFEVTAGADDRGLRNRSNDEAISDDLKASEKLNISNDIENIENDAVVHSHSTNNKITLNLQPGDEDDSSKSERSISTPQDISTEIPQLRDLPSYFKHAQAVHLNELEWTVTLSRYDFPWNEVAFDLFSAKDCYKMFRTIVVDPGTFLKKVLGEKVKFQRMMQNQIKGVTTIYPTVAKEIDQPSLKQTKTHHMSTLQEHQRSIVPSAIFGITHVNPNEGQVFQLGPMNQAVIINPNLYCKCKGLIQQEFMVACESGEDNCVNGGWLHPCCTKDLCTLNPQQIDAIDVWYCEDCSAKYPPQIEQIEPLRQRAGSYNQVIINQDAKQVINSNSSMKSKDKCLIISINQDEVSPKKITTPITPSPIKKSQFSAVIPPVNHQAFVHQQEVKEQMPIIQQQQHRQDEQRFMNSQQNDIGLMIPFNNCNQINQYQQPQQQQQQQQPQQQPRQQQEQILQSQQSQQREQLSQQQLLQLINNVLTQPRIQQQQQQQQQYVQSQPQLQGQNNNADNLLTQQQVEQLMQQMLRNNQNQLNGNGN